MNKKRNIVEWAMHYRQIVILITAVLVAFGMFALSKINKNEFPDFTVRQGVVVAVYPGATVNEMEEQVTQPLENYIFTYKDVKKEKTKSYTRNGLTIVQVELNDDIDGANKENFWSRFKLGVQQFKSSLPSSLAAAIPPAIAGMLPPTIPFSMINKGVMAGVMAVQPVFAGGQIVNGNKLAQVGVAVSELQKQVSANAVTLQAEQYFWQIVALKEKQKTLEAVEEMLKKLEKDADAAVKAGVGMRNDLLKVQLKENEIESNKLKLANGLKLARMVLAQYIGAESDIDVRTTIDPSVLPACPLLKIDDAQAVATTPEYQLLQKQVEATKLQRRMEVGKQLPKVAIGVGYNYYDMQRGMKNNFGAAFATVSVPISQWWGGSHAIKRKRLAEESAQQQLTDNAQLLKIRIQKNWNDLDNAYKQLLLAKKGIDQSEENLRLNRNFYQAGTITMNDLLDAQQQFQQSHDRYTEAYAALQTKMIEYEQSIGR